MYAASSFIFITFFQTIMYSDSVVDFTELLESMGASLMDFGNNGQQKSKLGKSL